MREAFCKKRRILGCFLKKEKDIGDFLKKVPKPPKTFEKMDKACRKCFCRDRPPGRSARGFAYGYAVAPLVSA
jgi:hypothetical protein